MSFFVAEYFIKRALRPITVIIYSLIEFNCIIMSFFVAEYITSCRINKEIISLPVTYCINICRTLCHFLSQANLINNSLSINYTKKYSLYNNLKNNLTNYSIKLFNEEEAPKPIEVMDLFFKLTLT